MPFLILMLLSTKVHVSKEWFEAQYENPIYAKENGSKPKVSGTKGALFLPVLLMKLYLNHWNLHWAIYFIWALTLNPITFKGISKGLY